MRGVLVRVGIDQAFGGWNAPVDPITGEFVYVPIPDGPQRRGLETTYSDLEPALSRFGDIQLPSRLAQRATHLDPDFEHLTYGDNGIRRGRGLADLEQGDVIAFFAGLRPVRAWPDPLLYGLIGVYRVDQVITVAMLDRAQWRQNAHTRRVEHCGTDLIVRARADNSGRLRRAIAIGEWRDRAYRVKRDLLEAWGGLSCRDGYIQRSAVPPHFLDTERFLAWLDGQNSELVACNNP